MVLAPTDQSVSDEQFEMIRELVYRHCRIRLADGKKDLVRTRMARCLRETGIRDVAAYLAHVTADRSGREFSRLIDAISTNLTSFFRERNHFHFIERQVLPELLAAKRTAGSNRLRIWSAGCSTGEEPYSIAMTVLKALDPHAGWDVKILASDISRRVLRIAKAASYEAAQVKVVPEPFRSRFFGEGRRACERGFFVLPEARNLVSFRYLNLAEAWPFNGPFDFIFCRNVMIYFDSETQQRLVNRCWDVLAPGGYLFTGHSESLNGLEHRFQYAEPTVYQKPQVQG